LWLGKDKPGLDGRLWKAKPAIDRLPLLLHQAVTGKVTRAPANKATEGVMAGSKSVVFAEASEAVTGEAVHIARCLHLLIPNLQWSEGSCNTPSVIVAN
jgi:hypothetical protein